MESRSKRLVAGRCWPGLESEMPSVLLGILMTGSERPSQTLVTRIAAISKSQIASDCNRNSKKSLRLRKHPLKPTLWTRESPVLCGFYSVSEALYGSGNPPEYVATTRVWFRIAAIFWANAISVIATLRFYCDFCGKSLRLRSCDCQSLAICDCDCVGH